MLSIWRCVWVIYLLFSEATKVEHLSLSMDARAGGEALDV